MRDFILAAVVVVLIGLFSLAGLRMAVAKLHAHALVASLCLTSVGALLALLDLVVA